MNRLYAPFRLVFVIGRALSENLAFLEHQLSAVHQRVDYGLAAPRSEFPLPWLCDLKTFSYVRAFFYLFGLVLTSYDAHHGSIPWEKVSWVWVMGLVGLGLIITQYRISCTGRFALLLSYATGFFDFTVLLLLGSVVGFDHPFVFTSISVYWVVMPLVFSLVHLILSGVYVLMFWLLLQALGVPLFRIIPTVFFERPQGGWLEALGFCALYVTIVFTASAFGQRTRTRSVVAEDHLACLNRYNALAQAAVSLAQDLSAVMNLDALRQYLETNCCERTALVVSASEYRHQENDVLLKGCDNQYLVLGQLRHCPLQDLLRSDFREVIVSLLTDKLKFCQSMQQMLRFQTEILPNEHLRAIGSLSAGIAHEVNNPLHIMTLRCQILQRDLAGIQKGDLENMVPEIQQGLEVIQSGCVRIEKIVSHMRILGKPFGKKIRNSLANQLEAATCLLDHQMKERKIKFSNAAQKRCATVMADNLAGQVFFNVLSNAVEALEEGGKIRVSAHDDANFVVVQVSDNGAGMDSSTVAKAFRPFFTTKFGKGGVGMGLTVSQKIMRDFGGNIAIESQPKKGTQVQLYFPKRLPLASF